MQKLRETEREKMAERLWALVWLKAVTFMVSKIGVFWGGDAEKLDWRAREKCQSNGFPVPFSPHLLW